MVNPQVMFTVFLTGLDIGGLLYNSLQHFLQALDVSTAPLLNVGLARC